MIIPTGIAAACWLRVSTHYGRVGGRVYWQDETAPRFAEFGGDWPLVTLQLVQERRRSRIQTAIQARPSSWHAHLPARLLGIPSQFRIAAADSRSCARKLGDTFIFDFTGMAPLPPDDLQRRAIILLDEIESLRRNHPEVLAQLGIDLKIHFHED